MKPRAGRSMARAADAAAVGPHRKRPLMTVSRLALLDETGDGHFRQLVYDLLTVAARMTLVREHLGRRMRLSGPQYSVLMAVLQLQGGTGVGASALAKLLHVSTAFIATETGKLARRGLLTKRPDPNDRRAVLHRLTESGRALIAQNGAEIRAVNDTFFGALTAEDFRALANGVAGLVRGSEFAAAQISSSTALELLDAAE